MIVTAKTIFLSSKAEGAPCSGLHKRLITLLGEKMALALWVAPEKAPLGVTYCSFGITKLRSSC
ncbi:MAG: hypothetical protein KZQ73_16400, partial [Candidatus Thiodiazotropha sp. (ex Semelilucina semeliformis)]|nr:hypothetical protein [Candidatus Thiodiazotropha sp. (ex Semelilucina semeliformis)]